MGRQEKIRKIIMKCFVQTKNKIHQCKFCNQTYTMNVTRMSKHLVEKCVRCPAQIKIDLSKNTKCSDLQKFKKCTTAADKNVNIRNTDSTDTMHTDNDDSDSSSTQTIISALSSTQTQSSSCSSARSLPRTLATLDSFVDTTSQDDQKTAWELLARACYATNTPLNFTENEHWQKLFHFLKPSLELPSRYQLSTPLLNSEYNSIKQKMKERIVNSKTVGIQIDGWTNIRREPIINIIVTTPVPVLYDVIESKTSRHDAEYMSQIIINAMEEIGIDKIFSIVTDNARNMKAAWNILREKFPDKIFVCYGCCAHILNLFIKDILKIKQFDKLSDKCRNIVRSIKNSHILLTTFNSVQEKNSINKKKIISLKLPGITRWGSVFICLKSLLDNKHNLQEFAITEEISTVLNNKIKSTILNDEFRKQINSLCAILSPVFKHITEIETTKPCISNVIEIFNNLKCTYAELEINNNFRDDILQNLDSRKAMAIEPIHAAANLLDPYFMGANLTDNEYINALTYINKIASAFLNANDATQVICEIAQYKSKEEFFSKSFLWDTLNTKNISAVIWWKSLCCMKKLSIIACHILNSPPTTAATERSFSTYGSIHTKNRNRLLNIRAKKLLYVKQNLELCNNNNSVQFSSVQCNTDEFLMYKSSDELESESESDNHQMSDNENIENIPLVS